MPLFSVIIPVYNVEAWLRECLDSVLAQARPDWECICVDDGSTDGSGSILDEYAIRDSRFHPIHQRHMGVGAARNAALDTAIGTWLVFLDGDDVLAPDSLAIVQKGILLFPDTNLYRFELQRFGETENPVFPRDGHFCWSPIDISKVLSLSDAYYNFCQFVYRRHLSGNRRFPHYLRGEDRVFLLSGLLQERTIVINDAVLYAYRTRTGSAMNSEASTDVLRDELEHRLEIIRMIDESDKSVSYAGSVWLEGYFISDFPRILLKRKRDRSDLAKDWLVRLKALRHADGLSAFARFLSWFIPPFRPPMLAVFICICLDSGRRRVARLFHRTIGALP